MRAVAGVYSELSDLELVVFFCLPFTCKYSIKLFPYIWLSRIPHQLLVPYKPARLWLALSSRPAPH